MQEVPSQILLAARLDAEAGPFLLWACPVHGAFPASRSDFFPVNSRAFAAHLASPCNRLTLQSTREERCMAIPFSPCSEQSNAFIRNHASAPRRTGAFRNSAWAVLVGCMAVLLLLWPGRATAQ